LLEYLYKYLLLLLLLIAIELSHGGSSPYISTDKQIIINILVHKRNNTKNTVKKYKTQ